MNRQTQIADLLRHEWEEAKNDAECNSAQSQTNIICSLYGIFPEIGIKMNKTEYQIFMESVSDALESWEY